jgi:hypothetical protein
MGGRGTSGYSDLQPPTRFFQQWHCIVVHAGLIASINDEAKFVLSDRFAMKYTRIGESAVAWDQMHLIRICT